MMRYHADVGWMAALVHPVVAFTLPLMWCFGVYSLASCMTLRAAVQDVKRYMQLYNVLQIVLCSYMVYGLMPVVRLESGNLFGLNTEVDERGEWFVFVHYLSKYLDWFDTLWIILKKNRAQLSFLHVYHHATIGMVWGHLLHNGVGGGTARYGAWINSLTHVFMYSHYLWTSFGLKNPFKRWLTKWQILQFYSCLVHAVFTLWLEDTEIWHFAWLQVLYQISMVYLFTLKMSYVPSCTPDMSEPRDVLALGKHADPKEAERAQARALAIKKAEDDFGYHPQKRYTVISGSVYDITDFVHPGGQHMIDLAVGRDATLMFESAHVRPEVPEKMLTPLLVKRADGTPVSAETLDEAGYALDRPKETWATPRQSELYEVLRKRVRAEVFETGDAATRRETRGVPAWHYLTVVGTWLACAVLFIQQPSAFRGALLGCSMAWIGLAVQHTGNHGGLCKNPTLGYLFGLLNDIAPGGSSLVWRYHHQVSHHAYCNDPVLDQDVHASFPVVRLEARQPLHPAHRLQWIYGPVVFCFLYWSIQLQDLQCLLDARTFLVGMRGTKAREVVLALLLKFIHLYWFFAVPMIVHSGVTRDMVLGWLAASACGSFLLSCLFIISHNLDSTKHAEEAEVTDWAKHQIATSSSWGGRVASFFTGGLNLQIEHHLFPCLPHDTFADIQKIVKEECKKRDMSYVGYDSLAANFADHIRFLYNMGRQDLGKKTQ